MDKSEISMAYDEIQSMHNEGKKMRQNLHQQMTLEDELNSPAVYDNLQIELYNEDELLDEHKPVAFTTKNKESKESFSNSSINNLKLESQFLSAPKRQFAKDLNKEKQRRRLKKSYASQLTSPSNFKKTPVIKEEIDESVKESSEIYENETNPNQTIGSNSRDIPATTNLKMELENRAD